MARFWLFKANLTTRDLCLDIGKHTTEELVSIRNVENQILLVLLRLSLASESDPSRDRRRRS
jgi:hypothetical protein